MRLDTVYAPAIQFARFLSKISEQSLTLSKFGITYLDTGATKRQVRGRFLLCSEELEPPARDR
jgi:hypothetical protein